MDECFQDCLKLELGVGHVEEEERERLDTLAPWFHGCIREDAEGDGEVVGGETRAGEDGAWRVRKNVEEGR